jgi:hypothetical protein
MSVTQVKGDYSRKQAKEKSMSVSGTEVRGTIKSEDIYLSGEHALD